MGFAGSARARHTSRKGSRSFGCILTVGICVFVANIVIVVVPIERAPIVAGIAFDDWREFKYSRFFVDDYCAARDVEWFAALCFDAFAEVAYFESLVRLRQSFDDPVTLRDLAL